MYNNSTTSLKQILWKVMNNPLVYDLTYELAAEYAIEAIRLVGATLGYVDKVTDPLLAIVDYKAVLPADIVLVRGIRAFTKRDESENKAIAMTYATDLYHNSSSCYSNSNRGDIGLEITYTIQSNIITTSFPDGFVEVAYQALPTDEDGFPLIPDNQDFLLAVEYYILFRYLEPLWMIGKITDKAFDYINTKKCWYIGAASSDMKIANMDHVEAMMNSINRLIINTNAQQNFFKFMGQKEHLRRY